jgi:hypothetical protein
MTKAPVPHAPASTPPPQYEPGGGKLLAVAFTLVGLALAGMAWSFFSRQNAPQDAPVIKSRFLPPSERKDASPAANVTVPAAGHSISPAPTFSPAATATSGLPQK